MRPLCAMVGVLSSFLTPHASRFTFQASNDFLVGSHAMNYNFAMANVVIVDDEATMLQMVADMLRKEGHQVFPYNSGKAALEALESHSPDLVISDLNLE